jgi:pimeloyl-ACP methyl ester carboxylesterase
LAKTAEACIFAPMHVELLGAGPRVVLVHGSIVFGLAAWQLQKPLAQRFTLVVPTRTGYPPNPPLARIDFDDQAQELADLLEPGDHLVGHSYGGVVSLLAAARRPELPRSLTVLEPPAFGVAEEERAVKEFLDAFGPDYPKEPRAYLEFFLPLVGSVIRLPDPLPPALEAGAAAAIVERFPTEAEIPFDTLSAAEFPILVVSGGHHPGFDAVADVLERKLGAERAVVSGAGHTIARAPGFNDVLADFLERVT